MVKSRRSSPTCASSSSSSATPFCSSSSSPSPAASLSLISNPPLLKPPTASCTPFISSLKRCPLVEVNAELSTLSIAEGRQQSDGSRRQIGDRNEDDNGVPLLSQVSVNGAGEDRCGRARLQHHWIQVGGKVMIPDTWGLERHLQEWVNFGLVEDAFRPSGLMSARSALVADCQRRSRAGSIPSSQQPAIVSSADTVQVSSCG
ncbi:hypothetical protein L7F22_003457 [Adiantum nelumboides]|nr:hypothetical protein [Adiantum nelumboides]